MSLDRHLRGKPCRTRGWRRWVRLVSLGVVLTLVVGVVYITRPARLASICEGILTQATGSEVTVESARLSFSGRLSMDGVSARVPDVPGEAGQLFEAEQVSLSVAPLSLLTLHVRANELLLIEPSIWLVEDVDEGGFFYQRLGGEGPGSWPDRLPQVVVRDATIVRGQVIGGAYEQLGTYPLTGSLTADPDTPQTYGFALESARGTDQGTTVLEGSFELGNQRVTAALYRLRYDDSLRTLMPYGMREWDSVYEPAGELSRFELTVGYDVGEPVDFMATIELEGGAVNLPYDEQAPRMTEVSGRFVVTPDEVRAEGLTGQIAGIQYYIDAVKEGLDAQGPFRLTAHTDDFDLPEDIQQVYALPRIEAVQNIFAWLSPSGRFRLKTELWRETAGEEVYYDGSVELIDALIQYVDFPYPMRNCTGLITFDNQSVRIIGTRAAGNADARVALDGVVEPPTRSPGISLRLTAEDVPVDATLMEAASSELRGLLEALMSSENQARLQEAGLIRSRTQETDPAVPVFSLSDSVTTIDLLVTRPEGRFHRTTLRTRVRGDGARLLMEAWPYPLVGSGGYIENTRGTTRVVDLMAAGPTGAAVKIDGRVSPEARLGSPVLDYALGHLVNAPHLHADFTPTTGSQPLDTAWAYLGHVAAERALPGREGGAVTLFRLSEVTLPLDELLVESIEAPRNAWLKRLGLSGALIGEGVIAPRADGEFDFRLMARLEGGGALPFAAELPFTDVNGRVTVSRFGLWLEDLDATRGRGTLTGHASLRFPGDETEFDLDLTANNLRIDESLIRLIPEELEVRQRVIDAFLEYSFFADVDASLIVSSPSEDHDVDFLLDIEPRRMSLFLDDVPVVAEELGGLVQFGNNEIILTNLTGQLDTAYFDMTGLVDLSEPLGYSLRLSAIVDEWSDMVHAVMPDDLTAVMDRIEFSGRARTDDLRLVVNPDAVDGESLVMDGVLHVEAASFDIGVDFREVAGRVEVGIGTERAREDCVAQITDADFRVMGRRVTGLDVAFCTHPSDDEVLIMRDLVGDIYGGTIAGEGFIRVDEDPQYYLDLRLNRAQIDPIIDPELFDPPGQPAMTWEREGGLVSASLAVQGVAGDPLAREGRGELEIEEAELFQRPLAIALLTAANFALPTYSSFDEAYAEYHILGTTMGFDQLRIEAPNVAIAGTGTLEIESSDLDLVMFTRRPTNLQGGGLGDGILDELLRIEVGGTLNEPVTRVKTLSRFFGSIGEVFGLGGSGEEQP